MQKTEPSSEETVSEDLPETPVKGRPRMSHDIDAHGNAGLGQVAKIGRCCRCGRDNRVVGPREFEPELRSCFNDCDNQKGPTPWETKMRKMGF